MQETPPDEIYNLGAKSHAAVNFESPEYSSVINALGILRLLGVIPIRDCNGILYKHESQRRVATLFDMHNFSLFGPCQPVAHDLQQGKQLALLKHSAYNAHFSVE